MVSQLPNKKIFVYPPLPIEIEAPERKTPRQKITLPELLEFYSRTEITEMFNQRIDAFATVVLSDYIQGPHSKMHMYLYETLRHKIRTGAREVLVAPRSSAKCIKEDTLIQLSNGELKKIKDIKIGDSLVSMSNDFKIINDVDIVTDKVYSGKKLVRDFIFRSGRKLSMTDEHRLFNIHGEICGADIKIGSKIATPKVLPCVVDKKNKMKLEEATFLACMLADGCMITDGNGGIGIQSSYTKYNPVLANEFIKAANVLGFKTRQNKHRSGVYGVSKCRDYLRKHKIAGCHSKDKFIPEQVFKQDNEFLALFLARYIDSDGWVLKSKCTVGISSISEQLIDNLFTICLRLGFSPFKNKRYSSLKGVKHTFWSITIDGVEACRKLYNEIPLLIKKDKLKKLLEDYKDSIPNPNWDTIDREWKQYLEKMTPHYLRKNYQLRVDSNKYHTSRNKLNKVAAIDDNDFLRMLANSDVFWDEVIQISDYYEAETYDIETSTNHNFIANNIVSHNSSLLTLAFPLWAICNGIYKFILIASDTNDQAEDFLTWIKDELESNEIIEELYPDTHGVGSVWRQDRIVTKNGILIRAIGSGSKVRGRRWRRHRPDLVLCHEKGTIIQDPHTRKWDKVENMPYPKKELVWDGEEVTVFGVPYSEVVTHNHKYWAKKIKFKINQWDTLEEYEAKWTEARDLTKHHFIGYPIDYTVENIQPIVIYCPKGGKRNKETGQFISNSNKFESYVPSEFYDPDFWWLVGYWWGNGHIAGRRVGFSVPTVKTEIHNKIKQILHKYKRSFYIINEKKGCFQIITNWAMMSRWFKEWKIDKKQAQKRPPLWVERIAFNYQLELVKGYLASDGYVDIKGKALRITSVSYEGLLSLRRILMRLGIPSSIRKGIGPRKIIIEGRTCNTQQKYDIRFRQNVKQLGYDIEDQDRYGFEKNHIKDGYFWSKVKNKKDVFDKVFVPITIQPEHCYLSSFGISTQCDDIENKQMIDSDTMRKSLITWFDQDLMKCGARAQDLDVFVAGTILHRDSLLNQLFESPKYANWHAVRFQAIEAWSTSPNLWSQWKAIYNNRFNPRRKYEAMRFFLQHKKEMLEGTKILWDNWDTYYQLMEELVSDGELAFFREKQNIPLNPEEQIFKEQNFSFYDEDVFRAIPLVDLKFVLYLDSSLGSKKKKDDPSSITILAKHRPTGYVYVVESTSKRISVTQQVAEVIEWCKVYPIRLIGVESNAFQSLIGDGIKDKLRQEQLKVRLIPINHSVSKTTRIESLEPIITNGTLLFNKNKHSSLISSLLWYPSGHDDEGDSLESATNLVLGKIFKPIFAENVKVSDTYAARDVYASKNVSVAGTFRYD